MRRRKTSLLIEILDLLLLPLTWSLQQSLTEEEIRGFYRSREWQRLRYLALAKYGRKCRCCGAAPPQARIVIDHIKPVRTHPHLRLKISNLQPLCDPCNLGKGSHDRTDWRRR